MKLSSLGEFGVIERIRRSVGKGPGLRLGIGDDCAATALEPGELLLTSTDLLIEEVHFRRAWSDLRCLGRKSVAVNVSDVAAMGGVPRHLFLGLALPAQMTVEDLDAFVAGFLEAAAEYGAVLVGGDTCRSAGPLMISVTVQGAIPEAELVSRDGAHPGDVLYVSGTLGDSALALRLLQQGKTPDPDLAARHHDPQARVALGRALASSRLATAMIDLSDGLVADLGHLLETSQLGAHIELAALPLSAELRRQLKSDPELRELPLSGGEDYELLFAVPPERAAEVHRMESDLGLMLTRIGEIRPRGETLTLLDAAGFVVTPGRGGYNHFA